MLWRRLPLVSPFSPVPKAQGADKIFTRRLLAFTSSITASSASAEAVAADALKFRSHLHEAIEAEVEARNVLQNGLGRG